MLSPGLDPLERRQYVDWLEIGNRTLCHRRELLEQPVRFGGRGIRPTFGDHFIDILLGDLSEGVRCAELRDQLKQLKQRLFITAA